MTSSPSSSKARFSRRPLDSRSLASTSACLNAPSDRGWKVERNIASPSKREVCLSFPNVLQLACAVYAQASTTQKTTSLGWKQFRSTRSLFGSRSPCTANNSKHWIYFVAWQIPFRSLLDAAVIRVCQQRVYRMLELNRQHCPHRQQNKDAQEAKPHRRHCNEEASRHSL
jgi:hypothetical protein